MTSLARVFVYRGVPIWRNVVVLQAVTQVLAAIAVATLIALLIATMMSNADRRGLRLGFEFLGWTAGFAMPDTAIPYSPSRSFLYAYWAGIANTFRAVLLAMFFTTVLGTLIGLARLSSNWLINRLATFYVETLRNLPLIVVAFFFYFGLLQNMPITQRAIHLPGPIFLSNRGVYVSWFDPTSSFGPWMLFILGGLVGAVALRLALLRYQEKTGRPAHSVLVPALTFAIVATVGWLVVPGSPLLFDRPVLMGTNFQGGLKFTPEFFAIFSCLTMYIASYIAEIVRGAVQSIPKGQLEAARALGLNYPQTVQHVILPQALRIIVPPLIGQYVNLTKGSALAIVVGYADVFVVTRTIIERTGRSPQMFLLLIATYLVIGAVYAVIGNIYNRRIRIVER